MNGPAKKYYYIWIGLLVAFAGRAGCALNTHIMASPDCGAYNDAAVQILNFTYPKTGFFRPPGYPLFLAALYKISAQNYLLVKIIQALMGALTCYFIMKICQKIFDRKTGYIAFILAIINPFLISFTGLLLSETLFTFLFIASMLTLVLFDRTNLKRYLVSSALLLALSALTRPIAVLFVPFLFIYLFFRSNKDPFSRVKDPAIFAICFICIIMPWTVRNYLVYREFILINNFPGLMVANANNKYAIKILDSKTKREYEYYHDKLRDYIYCSVKGSGSNSEMQQKLFKQSLDYIKSNPKEWVTLRCKDFLAFWRTSVSGMFYSRNICIVSFLYLFPIMFFGVFEFIRQFFIKNVRSSDMLLVLIILIVGSSHFIIGASDIRFRIPIIDPFLIIFASHPLCLFLSAADRKRKEIADKMRM